MAKLTPRQERFVLEYLIDLNGTQAAIRAGYSKKTATIKSSQLLTKVNIQDAISKGQKKRAKRTEITADRVLEEYAKIAFSNIDDYTAFNGSGVTLHNSKAIAREKLAAVESVSEGQFGVKIKLHNKLSALDSLAKHLGIDVPDKNETDDSQVSDVIKAIDSADVWNGDEECEEA